MSPAVIDGPPRPKTGTTAAPSLGAELRGEGKWYKSRTNNLSLNRDYQPSGLHGLHTQMSPGGINKVSSY